MNQENTKLTTVKILKDVYSSFKKVSFDSDVTLQKLVNRTVERYVSDEEFRKEMKKTQVCFVPSGKLHGNAGTDKLSRSDVNG